MAQADRFNAADVPKLPSTEVPGMISEEEQKLYYSLAIRYASEDRIVIEVGTWLGLSTLRICQGLEAALSDWRLFCYDRYEWSEKYHRKTSGRFSPELKPGDSFEWKFRENLGPYSQRIQTFKGEVLDVEDRLKGLMGAGDKIGVLYVDAAKGWGGNKSLLRAMAPHFVWGGTAPTRILFQDCLYLPSYKLLFLLASLDGLRPITYVGRGCSVVYEVRGDILEEPVMQEQFTPRDFTEDRIYRVWEKIKDGFPASKLQSSSMVLALPLMLWRCGYKAEAEKEYNSISIDRSAMRTIHRLMKSSTDKAIRNLPIESLMVAVDDEDLRTRQSNEKT